MIRGLDAANELAAVAAEVIGGGSGGGVASGGGGGGGGGGEEASGAPLLNEAEQRALARALASRAWEKRDDPLVSRRLVATLLDQTARRVTEAAAAPPSTPLSSSS